MVQRRNVDPDVGLYLGGVVAQTVSLVPGTVYDLSLWVRKIGGNCSLTLEVDRGTGTFSSFVKSTAGVPLDTWLLWAPGSVTAAGASGALRVRASGAGTVQGEWWADSLSMAGRASIFQMRELIRSGILTKLGAITTGGGYHYTATVVEGALRVGAVPSPLPVLALEWLSSRNLDEGTMNSVERTAWWRVTGWLRDEDATWDAIHDLAADVYKALETDQTLGGLTFLGAPKGRAVLVTDEDATGGPTEVIPGLARVQFLVRTVYRANPGVV